MREEYLGWRYGVLLLLLLAAWMAASRTVAGSTTAGARSVGAVRILVGIRAGVSDAADALAAEFGARRLDSIHDLGVDVLAVPAKNARAAVAALRRSGQVRFAELDARARTAGTVNDPLNSYQWGFTKVQATQAWDTSTGSSAVTIAILDTGIDTSHPDLAAKVIGSVNFSGSATTLDIFGHGTHVAGIAAADTNNAIGVAGLGYNSRLLNVKVLGDDGTGSYSAIAKGITWAADNGARVINLSLGGTSSSSTLQNAVDYAWNKGAVVVAAAGNNASSAPFYPAYYSNVIAVAATNEWDQKTPYTDYGDWVDVGAPGSNIYSTLPGAVYGNRSGTSMASPLVAGLAGLVMAAITDTNGNGRVNDEARACVQGGADNIGLTGIGSGRINAYASVVCATPASPALVQGTVTDTATGGPVAGATVTDGTHTVATDAQGAYTLSGLVAGSYQVAATASGYDPGSKSVSVAAGQTAVVDLVLSKASTPAPAPLWVRQISFRQVGQSLKVTVAVTSATGGVPGASVGLTVVGGSRTWSFAGTTDSTGSVSFSLQKPPRGTYTAAVTSITLTGYAWDTTQGIVSAVYTL